MAKKRAEPRRMSTPTPFEQARDELFSHILRCGVLEASAEHQKEWFDDTMLYLADRYEAQFTSDDESVLVQLAQMASIAIENALFAEEREANRIKDEFLSTLAQLRVPSLAAPRRCLHSHERREVAGAARSLGPDEGQSQPSVGPGACALSRPQQQLRAGRDANAERALVVTGCQREREAPLRAGAPRDGELRTPEGAVGQYQHRADSGFGRRERLCARRRRGDGRAGGQDRGAGERPNEARRRS